MSTPKEALSPVRCMKRVGWSPSPDNLRRPTVCLASLMWSVLPGPTCLTSACRNTTMCALSVRCNHVELLEADKEVSFHDNVAAPPGLKGGGGGSTCQAWLGEAARCRVSWPGSRLQSWQTAPR